MIDYKEKFEKMKIAGNLASETLDMLTNEIKEGEYFYFVHSYYIPILKETVGITEYKSSFSSIIQKDNFFGTQFHPEKSGLQGATLLSNFLNIQ